MLALLIGTVNFVDALFTSTSAVCVTGLITVDTQYDFTRFGQTVILVLIQFGGLGIMTFAALIIQIAGHRISFRSQAALHDVFFHQVDDRLLELAAEEPDRRRRLNLVREYHPTSRHL